MSAPMADILSDAIAFLGVDVIHSIKHLVCQMVLFNFAPQSVAKCNGGVVKLPKYGQKRKVSKEMKHNESILHYFQHGKWYIMTQNRSKNL